VDAPFLAAPPQDATPIFEIFRGNYGTELLAAAVAHFQVFRRLSDGPRSFQDLRQELGLAERPMHVLVTALKAFGLLRGGKAEALELTELARDHLVPERPFDVSGYVGLGAEAPGVLAMVERLRANIPIRAKQEDAGAAFIYREGLASAMDEAAAARRLTLSLAGRARIVAPVLAERLPLLDAGVLLDVGGGSGLYSIAYLQRHPRLRAIVWDRPEVLRVAAELAALHGVADRCNCLPGDMFRDPVPPADVQLLSNVLHDWDVPQCQEVIQRCAAALAQGGRLLIHDVFLADALDGPLPIALYSAALFCLTEGRVYSAAEYRGWLTAAGLDSGAVLPTSIHCGVLPATRLR
jgi:hypothetical protein